MTQTKGHTLDDGTISDGDFARIASLVRSMTGIDLQPHKRAMVAARLAKRMRATGMTSVSEYCKRLEDGTAGEETTQFVTAYTTNMTRFNREEHHFAHLADETLPKLVAAAKQGARVRIWSAGCSSGEEPYGLAFHLLDLCPEAHTLDLKILASDIDLEILARAKRGIYSSASLTTLPDHQAKQYFQPVKGQSDQMSVTQPARDLIAFRQLNLHGPWPFTGAFDVIICRNVAIYFDVPTQSTLWRRFAENLNAQGLLYIGHSEGIDADNTSRFNTVGRGVFQVTPAHQKTAKNGTSTHLGNAV
ncbi:Chemotaxis protein methyltransferase [Shimia sp. SK013]|uniref:protein-glutamate O-methyltransferase n=1 Tax=Shimia sp. SK013 TaxID=1389006 RepID=UPI0006B64051|nr:protein-glutamate O-methyltransferase [Shimia sp. SK013]KPA20853.1 Chemotaxis protein methyltransferase [Shimia sp. SK013]